MPGDLKVDENDSHPVRGTKLYEMLTWTLQPRRLYRNPFRIPGTLYNLKPIVETDINTAIVLHHQSRLEYFELTKWVLAQIDLKSHNRQLILDHSRFDSNPPSIRLRPRKWSLKKPITTRMFQMETNQDQTISAAETAIISILEMIQKLGSRVPGPNCPSSNTFHTCGRASENRITAQIVAAEESMA